MNIDYQNMTDQQMKTINEYLKNNMKKLKQVCYFVWGKNNIEQSYHDDLYDDAMEVLVESVIRFNPDGDAKFNTYLTNNIRKSYIEWYRDNFLRAKRNNLELDENGKIKRDENGKPIIISNLSLDAPTEDGINHHERIASDFDIDDELKLNVNDDKVNIFMNSLSKLQRKILMLKMEKYSAQQVKEKLNISEREYNSALNSIKTNDNLSLFTKNINDCDYKEDKEMERIMEINEADNYRTDKYSMYSLLDQKKSGDINCKYILQRKPFQWTQEERNRYICRLLSNLPIPEIILCEQNIKGMMISHLIDGLQRLSYAEAFKENRFKIGANGSERHLIQYRDFILDENGNRVLDDDGIPAFEVKVCDVVGKYYKDLPAELRKRFNNFNVNVTKFFNCTDEQIADHIRDYNNHSSMNNEQLGMTKISADTARKIKTIAENNTFFKNCGKYSDSNSIKGKIDRVVAESIMLLFHRDEWKSKLDKAYQYVDEHATDEEFYELNSDFNRLELALGEDNKELMDMFTTTNTPMWLAVFHEFAKYDLEDSSFVDFLRAYKNGLNEKEIDGVSMGDFKDMQTKKKATITGKVDLLVKLMKEYLHIEEEETENITVEEFISDVVDMPVETVKKEIDVYEDDLNGYADNVIKYGSKLLDAANHMSLLAVIAYAYQNDIEIDAWLKEYAENNNTYILNQKQNFLQMRNDLNKYQERMGVA